MHSIGVHARRISRVSSAGFALPTVLIASTIMMSLLLLSVQANTAVRAEINAQYYNQQARLASESGAARAQQCLASNGFVATWSDVKPLLPNTDCSGNVIGGYSAYVLSNSSMRTSFSVPAPTVANGTQRISVNGKVDLLRTSSNTVWRSYGQALVSQTGAAVTFNNVSFGYDSTAGSFFGTIGINGDVNALGYNGAGQLGTGNTTSGTAPRPYILPDGVRASQLYTNFVSQGWQMFALTTTGDVYGAGRNDKGQLGNGIISASAASPAKFNLPGGVNATYVGVLGWATYIFGDDNNIYAAGACFHGMLGSSYTIAGCADNPNYVRVNLPTPNLGDPNTLPVASPGGTPATNMALDGGTAYVRMQGGRVYGWGLNGSGQLGNGATADLSTPIQIGTYGNAGQPKATQLAFDGDSLYVLDDSKNVQAVGRNPFGDLAGGANPIQHSGTGMCLNNAFNSTTASRAELYTCVNAVSENHTFERDGSIQTHPNSSTNLCLDNSAGGTADGNPVQWWPCGAGNVNQQWQIRDGGSIYNSTSGKCLDDPGNSAALDTLLQLWTCNGSPAQTWQLPDHHYLTPISLPGTVEQIATDQWSILYRMTNGDVWAGGFNDRGQLCSVTGQSVNAKLTKVTGLPAGHSAQYIYTTMNGPLGGLYANSFIIMDDGSVWGCGKNSFGQLGNGTTVDSATPVKMNLPAGVRAKVVQSGLGTTVILTTTGSIYTVGNNINGQLGDGTNTNSSTPQANKYTNVIPLVLF